jgi:hypothetical protein
MNTIIGISIPIFTKLHVIISLVAIFTGFFFVKRMLENKTLNFWNTIFLITTVLTTATGFMFPLSGLTPAVITGIISTVILLIALFSLYVKHLQGPWRKTYIITALMAFYLNSFVAVVQSFQKIPALHELAPTQTEPPFAIAQFLVLVLFMVAGIFSVKRFKAI